jgi:hypothetical protein
MKNFLTGLALMLAVAGSLTACKDKALDPAPEFDEVPLILPRPTSDTAKVYLNFRFSRISDNALAAAGRTRPIFEFDFGMENNRNLKVKTVELYKSFRTGTTTLTFGPRVLVGSYSVDQLPVHFSQNSRQIIEGLQRVSGTNLLPLVPTPVTAGSNFINITTDAAVVFTFEYLVDNGDGTTRRIILTPLKDVKLTNTQTIQVISGTQTNTPYSAVAIFREPLR